MGLNDFFTNNAPAMSGVGSMLGGLGTIYAAYNQNKAANDALDWDKKVWANNQGMLNKTQNSLDSAIDSVYGQPQKKKRLGSFASEYDSQGA